jgi:hypothetical protein
VLFIFVIVAIHSSRVAHETTGYDEDQARIRTEKLQKLQASDTKTLTTADWVDKDKDIVRIPIDEAMVEEVPVLKAKPLAMGSEIPGAVAPAAPAAPATNSPPASGATANAPPATAGAPSTTGTPASKKAPSASTNAAPTEP